MTSFSTTNLVDADKLIGNEIPPRQVGIDDYVSFVSNNIGLLSQKHIIGLGFCMVDAILISPKKRDDYMKCRAYLAFVSLQVTGNLYTLIRKLEYEFCNVEPVQAPRGWKCAICISSKDSHLCEKTLCGHYFHIGCTRDLTSPACPLCRSFM